MKTKFIQKMMASALTVALIAAPSMGVMAAGSGDPITGSGDPVIGGSCGQPAQTVEEQVIAIVNESSDGGSSVSSIAEIPVTNTVAGVKSTVQGVYIATNVNGTAITSGLSGIARDRKSVV